MALAMFDCLNAYPGNGNGELKLNHFYTTSSLLGYRATTDLAPKGLTMSLEN